MVRTKTPAKSSRDLYPSSLSTTSSTVSRSRVTSPSSSREDIRREHNPLDASNSKSSSNRKGIPRKSTPKSRTKLFVRKTAVDKSGKQKSAKAKILREIRFLQSTVNHLIPKQPFSRVVREIMQNRRSDLYISSIALEALQEATEIYLTCLFADSNIVARHSKRVTIRPIDMALVLNLRQNH
ncbi:hypothetical protein WA026_008364 [Henosepilachna vigintioctopunctata]|uniref:Core Histone H2A/H2B/H3 domain-containing protein n=1 Tax=Henosepilachna vigintioctopunctata TaxID=420089 RepID=A0AAW1UIG9_9CUCU